MKQLLYGTTNKSKISQIKDVLSESGYEILGLDALDVSIPAVEEDGRNVEENARKKAIAYAQAANLPTLAMDTGFYIDRLSDEQQPGLHVRRINKSHEAATDQEVLDHYMQLIGSLGGTVTAYWRYSFALAHPDGSCHSFTADTAKRRLTATPAKSMVPGFPLDALQVDPSTGKYFSDMDWKEKIIAAKATERNEMLVRFIGEYY